MRAPPRRRDPLLRSTTRCQAAGDQRTTHMTMTPEQAGWFQGTFGRLVENVEQVLLGKTSVIRLSFTALLSDGHLLLEDFPGTGKTSLARAMAADRCRAVEPHPVHPGPSPRRHHGRHHLRPAQQPVRVPPWSRLRQHRARRRDQPRQPQDPVGSARGDGGGTRDCRRQYPRGRLAVHGDRNAEPDRAGRHLPAARRRSSTASS